MLPAAATQYLSHIGTLYPPGEETTFSFKLRSFYFPDEDWASPGRLAFILTTKAIRSDGRPSKERAEGVNIFKKMNEDYFRDAVTWGTEDVLTLSFRLFLQLFLSMFLGGADGTAGGRRLHNTNNFGEVISKKLFSNIFAIEPADVNKLGIERILEPYTPRNRQTIREYVDARTRIGTITPEITQIMYNNFPIKEVLRSRKKGERLLVLVTETLLPTNMLIEEISAVLRYTCAEFAITGLRSFDAKERRWVEREKLDEAPKDKIVEVDGRAVLNHNYLSFDIMGDLQTLEVMGRQYFMVDASGREYTRGRILYNQIRDLVGRIERSHDSEADWENVDERLRRRYYGEVLESDDLTSEDLQAALQLADTSSEAFYKHPYFDVTLRNKRRLANPLDRFFNQNALTAREIEEDLARTRISTALASRPLLPRGGAKDAKTTSKSKTLSSKKEGKQPVRREEETLAERNVRRQGRNRTNSYLPPGMSSEGEFHSSSDDSSSEDDGGGPSASVSAERAKRIREDWLPPPPRFRRPPPPPRRKGN